MSSYTMELRTYVEKWSQYESDKNIQEKIEEGRKHLFDFDYPIISEDYKVIFETNFIKNFYMREIGFETEELFKLKLDSWLNINMPYYNKLLESELLEYDPLTNTKVTIDKGKLRDKNLQDRRDGISDSENTGNETSTGQSSSTEGKEDFNRKIESDTPDERLRLTSNTDGSGVIEYASGITEDKASGSTIQDVESESNSNISSTGKLKTEEDYSRNENEKEDSQEIRKGKIGQQSFASMLLEHRNTFLRIERMIFNEMNELFMLVY